MISLIFDLDDTLYFQKDQFVETVKQTGYLQQLDKLEELYIFFQEASEWTYKLQDEGQLTLDEMRILRVTEAYQKMGIKLTKEEAISWQQTYEKTQKDIQLNDSIKEMLTNCRAKSIQLGIITNGPSEHQRMKIKALGLEEWFQKEHIVVSGDVGISKPNKVIFDILEERLARETSHYFYIGDNYENDVIGSLNKGWQPIWLNHKQEKKLLTGNIIEVFSRKELISEINKIVNK